MLGHEADEIYFGEYKIGFLGKKNKVTLYAYFSYIRGIGTQYKNDSFWLHEFEIELKNICEVKKEVIDGMECLAIEYIDNQNIFARDAKIFFPNLNDIEGAIDCINQKIDKFKAEEQRRKDIEEQRKIKAQEKLRLCEKFYSDCYDFHIKKDDNPYYELQREGLSFACIYIDKYRNLNFLKIDGNCEEESNACIPYHKIHYYEKAGSIHYTPDINGKVSSFGGSVMGATISKAGTLFGGLLFGPMGMAAGAVLTYKPQKVIVPKTEIELTSETKTIDDRSVILNYYSDVKRQYIDVELPADMYNFLQTHYSEKKYDIVLEVEKHAAIGAQKNLVGIQEPKEVAQIENGMDSFENRVKKLKLMYDNGLLSGEEFLDEKRKLLEMI